MIAKKFLLYLVLCLGKIFLLLLCTVLWTFRFFPTTVQRAVSNALRFVARVGQQRPVDHLLPRPRWDRAVLLADETSTVLELKQSSVTIEDISTDSDLPQLHICSANSGHPITVTQVGGPGRSTI